MTNEQMGDLSLTILFLPLTLAIKISVFLG